MLEGWIGGQIAWTDAVRCEERCVKGCKLGKWWRMVVVVVVVVWRVWVSAASVGCGGARVLGGKVGQGGDGGMRGGKG